MIRLACIPKCGQGTEPCQLKWFLPICWCPPGGQFVQAKAPDTAPAAGQ